jgi:hypothetical protein
MKPEAWSWERPTMAKRTGGGPAAGAGAGKPSRKRSAVNNTVMFLMGESYRPVALLAIMSEAGG